jgi:hypothetical protein
MVRCTTGPQPRVMHQGHSMHARFAYARSCDLSRSAIVTKYHVDPEAEVATLTAHVDALILGASGPASV